MKYRIIEGNSFGRLYQHLQGGFVCISACRETLSDRENDQRTRELRATLKKLQLGYWKTKGGYLEDSTETDKIYDDNKELMKKLPVYEDSFLVPYFGEYGDFNEFVLELEELGNKYDQDAILVKPNDKDKSAYFLYQDGKIESIGKDIKFSNALQYFSKIRNKDAHFSLVDLSDEERDELEKGKSKKWSWKEGKLVPLNENMKFYFESPSSSFSAQSLAINGQYWNY